MGLINRLERLERSAGRDLDATHDLTLLTDAELLALEACFSQAVAEGRPVDQYITPELVAALRRIER